MWLFAEANGGDPCRAQRDDGEWEAEDRRFERPADGDDPQEGEVRDVHGGDGGVPRPLWVLGTGQANVPHWLHEDCPLHHEMCMLQLLQAPPR